MWKALPPGRHWSSSHIRSWPKLSGSRPSRSAREIATCRRRDLAAEVAGEGGAEILEDRRVEKQLEREVGAERGDQPGPQPGGDQAVAAEAEELVAPADLGHAEQGRPDRGHLLLEAGQRRLALAAFLAAQRHRQGPPVDLAVGGERQPREPHQVGRNHVVRQLLPQRGQNHGVVRRFLAGGEVGDQPGLARRVLAQQHQGLGHSFDRQQVGLDLGGFDAEAAQLDLVVDPAEELQLEALRPHPHQVAGQVEPLAVAAGKRHETLRGLGRPAEVAVRQADAAERQLAGRAER